jgi:UPF0755 protein
MRLIPAITILAIALSGIGFLYFNWSAGTPLSPAGAPVLPFTVEPGQGVKQIAAKLEAAGLVRSGLVFRTYLWRMGWEGDLKAGQYYLSQGLAIKEIAKILKDGQVADRERDIKVIEGWNITQADAALAKAGAVKAGDYAALALAPVGEWALPFARPGFLKSAPGTATLEGYLFPDTYRIFNDATAADIIRKQLDNFGQKISPALLAEIQAQEKSLFEIVTMASLVEKEVANEKDKKIVAGILWKRLDSGMRLQLDSTINYITGKNDPAPLLSDLEKESPYNTYRNDGLPPGPIANPGLSSIQAAVYPEENPYFFYLNRQDTKETIFSKTFEEHVANKNKYLK